MPIPPRGWVEMGAVAPLLLLLLVLMLLLLLPPAPKTEPLIVVAVVAVAATIGIELARLVAWDDDNSKLLSTLAVRESERCFFKLDNVAL